MKHRINEQAPGAPLIMVTARAEEHLLRHAAANAPFDLPRKPFEPDAPINTSIGRRMGSPPRRREANNSDVAQEAIRNLESVVSSRYGVPAPTIISHSGQGPALALSRLACDDYGNAPSKPPDPEDAYLLHVLLRDVEIYGVQFKGQRASRAAATRGGVFLASCRQQPTPHLATPFEIVRIYVSRSALEDHAGPSAKAASVALRLGQQGAFDPVLLHLIGVVLPVFGSVFGRGQLLVDSIALAIQDHLLRAYAGCGRDTCGSNRGLPPRLEKRAKEFIESRLRDGTSLEEVSKLCGLSPSHFSKGFRISTGKPPHRWMLERRIESAKSLLTDQSIALSDVAKLCGFSDASHFSRTFSQLTREPPTSWRRRNRR